MSNLTQNTHARPSKADTRRSRLRAVPAAAHLKLLGRTPAGGWPNESAWFDFLDKITEQETRRKLPPNRRLREPRLVETFPHAVAVQFATRRFGVYKLGDGTADVAVLTQREPDYLCHSEDGALGVADDYSRETELETPFIREVAQIHVRAALAGRSPSGDEIATWLRESAPRIYAAFAAYTADLHERKPWLKIAGAGQRDPRPFVAELALALAKTITMDEVTR